MDEQIRLSKLMAQQGLSSRREADKLISAGQVLVNGEIIKELGTKVHPGSDIKLAAIAQRKREKLATLILNKPAGWVSNQPEKGYEEAASLIIESNRSDNHEDAKRKIPPASTLNVAGRLDIDWYSPRMAPLPENSSVPKTTSKKNIESGSKALLLIIGSNNSPMVYPSTAGNCAPQSSNLLEMIF